MIIVLCPHSNTFMVWLFASVHGFTALMIDSSWRHWSEVQTDAQPLAERILGSSCNGSNPLDLHDFGNHNSKQLLCEVAHVAIVPGHRGRAGELRDLHDLLMDAAIYLLLAHVRHVPSGGGKEWCEDVMGLEWFGSVKNLISN